MELLAIICQLAIAAGIVNVWLIRFNRTTSWRGGEAGNMAEEFAVYGLSQPVMRLVGGAKLLLAALLLIGIWVPAVAAPAAALMGLLMIGAIGMHLKVKDPLKRSLPAFTMLVMSLIVVLAYL
ncbi:MAG: DoxX family protein [Rhodothermales bacterium]|nr:DoxX family protein [Rhodothermales bacterium]